MEFGTVSHGTMRSEDLIPVFIEKLWEYDEREARAYQDAVPMHADRSDWWGTSEAGEMVIELADSLSEHAPDFAYFGAHPGDGSDYGFWPDWDAISEAEHSGEIFRTDDSAKLASPENTSEYGFVVNDHGNGALFHWDSENNEWAELWAVV